MSKRYTLLLDFGFYGINSLYLKNVMDYARRHSKTDSTDKISAMQIYLSDETDANNMFISLRFKNPFVIFFIQLIKNWNRVLKQNLKQPYKYYYSILNVDIFGKAHYSKIPDIENIESGSDISSKGIKNSSKIVINNSNIHPLSNKTAEKITESQFKIIINPIKSVKHSCLVTDQFNYVYLSLHIDNFKLESVPRSCRNTRLPQIKELKK